MGRGAARLPYRIVDEMVAGHMPVVDAMDEEMDRIEELILSAPGPQSLPQVLRVKRALLHLRRIIAPQRETLNHLAREGIPAIPAGERVYFRDVYDHLVRLYDIVEGLRDLVAGALDTYLSMINNKMNEVMKTFTFITVLFMPISFPTGFFGMNFFTASAPPPAWTGRMALIGTCAAIVMVPILMYAWLNGSGECSPSPLNLPGLRRLRAPSTRLLWKTILPRGQLRVFRRRHLRGSSTRS
jgi:magnesium transporter